MLIPALLSTLHIRRHERGLLFVRGDLRAVLGPGTHLRVPLYDGLRGRRVEVLSCLAGRFEHPLLDVLAREPALRADLHVLELSDAQRALVWKDGRLDGVLGPGRHAYWKAPAAYTFDVVDAKAEPVLTGRAADVVAAHPTGSRWVRVVEAAPGKEALVFRDATLVARVTAGRLVLWLDARSLTVEQVELREQTADVAGQEIMTQDKVTLRVNLVLTWQVEDALASVTRTTSLERALYREAQLALRVALGARSLDSLLSDKETVGTEVERTLAERARSYGAVIRSVGIRDIVLPGEMRTILNQVIEAEKRAQANLIRRREETAAARSQANTARLLAENPVLLRMKELESLQEILAGTKATFVLGAEPLAGQVRRLLADEAGTSGSAGPSP